MKNKYCITKEVDIKTNFLTNYETKGLVVTNFEWSDSAKEAYLFDDYNNAEYVFNFINDTTADIVTKKQAELLESFNK